MSDPLRHPDGTPDPLEHILPTVHEAVRKSRLMTTLHERLASLPPGAFPFVAELSRLRDVVAPQIGETRVLFGEFTPHDELLHVAKLFQLADRFLDRAYAELNVAELFLLAAALYAHDWGMAVGRDEIEFLRARAVGKKSTLAFVPLSDENARLEAFVRSEGLQDDCNGLSDDHLRLYVRLTHARRSGARVRAHFREYPAVGEALAHLCEGHWHDFATLDDPQRFPREYEVAGHSTHILALALHLRLIDLFHISDDRTPYALWKFVSPKDRRSSEEWKKHRAIHGVSLVAFHLGRAIKVQGFTDDEEVWAGLKDLHRYCAKQVEQTFETCARHVPRRYELDFVKLEWAVTTGELRPVDLSFGFDSKAVFRILSEEIYDGDRHVFIRELLQNSIDAIRTRLARHRQNAKAHRKKYTATFDTTIYFTVEHLSTGDVRVTCRDYGIGMDEHILRNYFAIAGVSYYRSETFRRLHLDFEPVSRFGIGVLSCFMVAESISVRTFRDPECMPSSLHQDASLPGSGEFRSRRLRLDIPAVHRQFIVKDLRDEFSVGTEVSLLATKRCVEALKSQSNEEAVEGSGFRRMLTPTEYLKEIAGFVEFPIFVEESWPGLSDPLRTLILHPDENAEEQAGQFASSVSVHQLSIAFPWDSVMASHSVLDSRHLLTETAFDLKKLLGDSGYEGWIVFATPRDENVDFAQTPWGEVGMLSANVNVSLRDRAGKHEEKTVDWIGDAGDHYDPGDDTRFGVYRDGLLLKNVERPPAFTRSRGLPAPSVRINLSSTESPLTNVARTDLKADESHWFQTIWKAVQREILSRANLRDLCPPERFYHLGWLRAAYGVSLKEVVQSDISGKVVLPWIDSTEGLVFLENGLAEGCTVPVIPTELDELRYELLAARFDFPGKHRAALSWEGPRCLAYCPDFNPMARSLGEPIAGAIDLVEVLGDKHLCVDKILFAVPPAGRSHHLIIPLYVFSLPAVDSERDAPFQERSKFLRRPEVCAALKKASDDPSQLSPRELGDVVYASRISRIVPVEFSKPFHDKFMCGSQYVNKLHPIGLAVIKCVAATALAELHKKLSQTDLMSLSRIGMGTGGVLHVAQRGAFSAHIPSPVLIRDAFDKLFEIVRRNGLLSLDSIAQVPATTEWVPTIDGQSSEHAHPSSDPIPVEDLGTCGKLIEVWPIAK